MAHSMNEASSNSESTLSEMFDHCLERKYQLEDFDFPSSSNEYQGMVKKSILMLESVTHMVNNVDMFSANETIDEVPTSNLKFIILPALLGYFNYKIQFTTKSCRLDQLLLCEAYFKDFLKRCKNYEVPDVEIPPLCLQVEGEEETNCPLDKGEPNFSMKQLVKDRKALIKRYKQSQKVEKTVDEGCLLISKMDEEAKRNHYLLLIQHWVFKIVDEMGTLIVERQCLELLLKAPPEKRKKYPPPTKPMIIVRTELQKKVFGAGYPSLPTLTVDEFYAQRYPAGQQSQQAQPSPLGSLQQRAADSEAAARALEAEDVEMEEKIEKDDEPTLKNARLFDEWKDENRRGSGNRKNMG